MTPSWIGQSRDWSVFLGPIFYILISREKKTQKWTLEDHQRDSPQMPSPPLTQQD